MSGFGGGAGAFTPASLTGLIGWYEADVGLLTTGDVPAVNNDPLKTWQDQSGGSHHLVAGNLGASQTGTYKTTGLNGKKTIYFQTGQNNVMHCSSFPMGTGNKGSVYMYGAINTASSLFDTVVGYIAPTEDMDGSHSCIWARCLFPPVLRADHAAFGYSSGSVTLDVGTRFGSSFDGSNNTFIINGSEQTPAAVSFNFTNAGEFLIGAKAVDGSTNSPDFYVSAIVVTTNSLTGTDLSNLDTYMTRWN